MAIRVLASSNTHKIKEFKEIFNNDQILSLKDIGFDEKIDENGNSFLENALIKAKAVHAFLKKKKILASVIADDSGLCVDSLDGAPGIYSARYAGTNSSDKENRDKLLKEMRTKENRKAHFVCVIVEYFIDGSYIYSQGYTYGTILYQETGDTSFGYDCLFFSNELNKCFGLATSQEKNKVSHRYKAILELLYKEKERNIFISEVCGLCYGAKRSLSLTNEQIEKNKKIILYKEILHNSNVIKSLEEKGIKTVNNLNDINKDDLVIIRAHGEPYNTFKYLEEKHIKYVDCTCPNVKAINYLVQEKDNEGYKIIILGKYGFSNNKMHPEVEGIAGWCSNPLFIEDESEIEKIDLSYDKYFLVVQTTFSKDKTALFIQKIKKLMKNNNKIFDYKNTICNAQKLINDYSTELAKKVDVMIIMGGKNSSNTKELFNNVSKIKKSFFIEKPEDVINLIKKQEIKNGHKIGLSAGASTLKEDILKLKEIIINNL